MPLSITASSSTSEASSSSIMTSNLSKRFTPTGQAVRILSSPFPIECPLVHSTIPLPSTGKLGVRFRWNGRRSDRVVITAMDDDSPVLEHSTIQPHDTVVAVNHVAALKSSQVGHLIRSCHETVTLTTLPATTPAQQQLPPFTKVTATPLHPDQPPIAVDSTRGRCLVRVSRVWGMDVNEGDIVLSLQGIPVTTPAAVDHILLGQEASYMWMYTVDMQSYRASVAWELQSVFPGVVWRDDAEKYGYTAAISIGHDVKNVIGLEVDRETLHVRVADTARKTRHTKLFKRYLHALNQGIEDRLRLLETVVCGEAYVYERRRRLREQDMRQVESPSTIPSVGSSGSSSQCSNRRTSKTTDSTASSSSFGASSEEGENLDYITSVPAALVMPLSALQTSEERESAAAAMVTAGAQ